jgi:hypothetical protein
MNVTPVIIFFIKGLRHHRALFNYLEVVSEMQIPSKNSHLGILKSGPSLRILKRRQICEKHYAQNSSY